jgi:hypothetical protein
MVVLSKVSGVLRTDREVDGRISTDLIAIESASMRFDAAR